ncbi:MAG: penicillin-binding protein [Streptosporangiaceae bacterium]|nr:penicillin-binding protein [Streptosporangiaceae bacterium]MBV9853938.1 penicillin-binding protein [Streptosporangiaceae bacterium]
MQLADLTSSKTSAVGRLITLAAAGGLLAAAMVVPVVAATGILVRNEADKFTSISFDATSGLPQRSAIYDRNGRLITYVYGVDLGPGMTYAGIDRQPVGYNQISPQMQQAIVAIEDSRYWQHGAIDLKGTIRALVNDLRHQPIQGGSTIAQQYVKDVLILQAGSNQAAIAAAQARTLYRKLNELRMAVALEHQMSKQQILAGYLNDAYFGNGAWGIEAAAETYFGTTAASLDLTQAATLAGVVENPSEYDPIANPAVSVERRNTVLARMEQTHWIGPRVAAKAESEPLGLSPGAVQSGCGAPTVGDYAFDCDFVMHTLLLDKTLGKTTQARARLLATGGLHVYTTFDPRDQRAATRAVNWVMPAHDNNVNPAHNADTEVLVQPGTGRIRAIAEDRPYGTGRGQTEVDYAVNTADGGSSGVQTGSSSKLFTLVTALEQGVPFGYTQTVPGSTTINGYANCAGDPVSPFNVTNSEGPGTTTDSLYTGTTHSINVFFAELEKKVGLCNVVRTAMTLGLTRADGSSLLSTEHTRAGTVYPADDFPAFTLGVINVSPMSMAAAYATMAARGVYCSPVAISRITAPGNRSIAVPSARCHRAISAEVADAVSYILSGVFTNGATAAQPQGPGPIDRPAAGKTGTSNVTSGNGTPYAAFGGYTPTLASYTSVFNPASPTTDTMAGTTACYRLEFGGVSCPSEMFGAMAPGSTWHMTFDHASLGPALGFMPVPGGSELWSQGDGQTVVQPGKGHKGGGGNGGGPGPGHP